MAEKMIYASEELDDLRAMLMLEPRGHRDMYGAVLTTPSEPEADLGLIFMNTLRYTSMCGHATIGAATTVAKTGIVPLVAPSTDVVFDTPVGLVRTEVSVEDGRVGEVSFANAPVFVYALDVPVTVPGVGDVQVDVVYSGGFFALMDVRLTGLSLTPGNAGALARLGVAVRRAVNDQVPVQHPELSFLDSVEAVEFHAPVEVRGDGGLLARNAAIFGECTIDRSPCGTGTGARMAVLHARDQLQIGQQFTSESIVGTRFTAWIAEETEVAGYPAIVPLVAGRAFLTGFNRFIAEAEDPFPHGFSVSSSEPPRGGPTG
jgi:proline racemase